MRWMPTLAVTQGRAPGRRSQVRCHLMHLLCQQHSKIRELLITLGEGTEGTGQVDR